MGDGIGDGFSGFPEARSQRLVVFADAAPGEAAVEPVEAYAIPADWTESDVSEFIGRHLADFDIAAVTRLRQHHEAPDPTERQRGEESIEDVGRAIQRRLAREHPNEVVE